MRSDPSSVISTASTMATPAKLEAGDRVLGTYGDETRRPWYETSTRAARRSSSSSPTPRSASQVSSMFARDVSFVSRPAKPHALAHLLPPKLGDALGRTVNLEDAFRDAEAIGIYIVDQARPSAAATERLANLRRWVGGSKFGVADELSSQMPGDVDMTLKAKGGHRVLLGDDANVLVVDSPETVVTNWNLFEVCSVRQLPALVVVSPSAEVFTRDGVEALCSTAEFPWRGYQSPQTKRLEFKRKAIHACLARRRRLIGAAGRLPRALLRALGAGRPRHDGVRLGPGKSVDTTRRPAPCACARAPSTRARPRGECVVVELRRGSPPPPSPRARPSGWTRTQGLSRDSQAPLFLGRPRGGPCRCSSFTTSRNAVGVVSYWTLAPSRRPATRETRRCQWCLACHVRTLC